MPGIILRSLEDEALTFNHDGQLVGYCLDNPDEPFGDDFATRCANKINVRIHGHAYFDAREGFCTPQDIFGDHEKGVEDDVIVPSDEVRTAYEMFKDMNNFDQAAFMYKLTMHICELIGVSVCDWEPTDDFVLDAIETTRYRPLSDEVLRQAALKQYYATRSMPDEDMDLVGREDDDVIRIGQMSSRGGLPNIGRRFGVCYALSKKDNRTPGSRSARTNHPKSHGYTEHSHSTKYGRQDYRHQLPRLEAKGERRYAKYEAKMEDFYSYMEARQAFDAEKPAVQFMTVREQMQIPVWELRGGGITTQDVADLGDYLEEQRFLMEDMRDYFHGRDWGNACDVAGTAGYMPGDFERRGYYGLDRSDDERSVTLWSGQGWDVAWVKSESLNRPLEWSFGEFYAVASDSFPYPSYMAGREDFRSGRGDFDDDYDDWMDGIHDRCDCPACRGDLDDYTPPRSAGDDLIDRFGDDVWQTVDEMFAEEAWLEATEIAMADSAYYPQGSRVRIPGRNNPEASRAIRRAIF